MRSGGSKTVFKNGVTAAQQHTCTKVANTSFSYRLKAQPRWIGEDSGWEGKTKEKIRTVISHHVCTLSTYRTTDYVRTSIYEYETTSTSTYSREYCQSIAVLPISRTLGLKNGPPRFGSQNTPASTRML
jgi:hypothetical protein